MDDELQALQERIERLLQNARRLADENRRLRGELANALEARHAIEVRMTEARSKVEAALSRLPALGAEPRDAAH
ncbi:MAG TPA: hypothetical protein VEA81_11370 [Burkholderiaceae bacterium]|nr:hypothetical protein [Burkholderiaceae bacterium]